MSAVGDKIAAEALRYVGTKWRHHGRSRHSLDCIGLGVVACQAAGVQIPPMPRHYGREPWNDLLRRGLQDMCGDPVTEYQSGDIALFAFVGMEPYHVGVIAQHPLQGLMLVHADVVHGVIAQYLSDEIRKDIVAVYRVPEARA